MVNQEILGGLQSASDRGESLGEAISSLASAGYNQREIEAAVSLLQGNVSENPSPIYYRQTPQGNRVTDNLSQPSSSQVQIQRQSNTLQQKVSSYEQKKESNKTLTMLLIVMLCVVVLAGIATIFLFWGTIADFFSNLFV